jgi:hypothetical protein
MIVFVVRSSRPFLKALASDYINQKISEKQAADFLFKLRTGYK